MLGAGTGVVPPRDEQRLWLARRMGPDEGEIFTIVRGAMLAEKFHDRADSGICAVTELFRRLANTFRELGSDAALVAERAGDRHLGDATGLGDFLQSVSAGAGHVRGRYCNVPGRWKSGARFVNCTPPVFPRHSPYLPKI